MDSLEFHDLTDQGTVQLGCDQKRDQKRQTPIPRPTPGGVNLLGARISKQGQGTQIDISKNLQTSFSHFLQTIVFVGFSAGFP